MTPKQLGFTLIELLVVIVIIGIVASISIPNISGYQDRAKNTLIIHAVGIYTNALKRYKATDGAGSYPSTLSSARRCVGEGYPGGLCQGGTVPENPALNDDLRPHVSNLPLVPFSFDDTSIDGAVITANTGVTLDGVTTPVYIDYNLYGANQDCKHSPIGRGTFPNYLTSTTGNTFSVSGRTVCRLFLRN